MFNRIIIQHYRILLIAIFISFIWHLFWLSAIKVVASPVPTKSIKFSRVAFLGPLLTKGAMEVRLDTQERSLLERRYRNTIGYMRKFTLSSGEGIENERIFLEKEAGTPSPNKILTSLIEEAVGGQKLEPPNSI